MRQVVSVMVLSVIILVFSFSDCLLAEEYHMLATEEASTIGQRNVRTDIEFGVIKQPDASELYSVPRVRLTYGLSEWADVEFEYEALVVNDTDFTEYAEGKVNIDHDGGGTGDLRIRVKVRPYEFGRHQMGFQFMTKLPNASQAEGLGTNETDFSFRTLLSSDWDRFKTHLNAGVAVTQDVTRNGNLNNFILWGVAGEYALTDYLTLMGEVEGSVGLGGSVEDFTENIAEGSEGKDRARARLALTGPIGGWMWGVSAFKGLNNHTEDWGAQVGLSRTWGPGGSADAVQVPRTEARDAESYYNPLKTVEAYTIPERDFRTEVALGYVNQPDGSDLYLLPDLNVGWGLGPWSDLEIGLQYLAVRDTSRFDVDGNVIETDMDEHGIGDLRVKFKATPFNWRPGRLGLQLVTKVMGADDHKALGTDELDFSFRAVFSTDWAEYFEGMALGRLKTHCNLGLAIQADPKSLAWQDDYIVWGIAGEYEIMSALTLWGEVEGSTNGPVVRNISEGDYGNAFAEARLGLTGPMPGIAYLKDWSWGITASTGLNGHSRDWTASIGLSRTWGI